MRRAGERAYSLHFRHGRRPGDDPRQEQGSHERQPMAFGQHSPARPENALADGRRHVGDLRHDWQLDAPEVGRHFVHRRRLQGHVRWPARKLGRFSRWIRRLPGVGRLGRHFAEPRRRRGRSELLGRRGLRRPHEVQSECMRQQGNLRPTVECLCL